MKNSDPILHLHYQDKGLYIYVENFSFDFGNWTVLSIDEFWINKQFLNKFNLPLYKNKA